MRFRPEPGKPSQAFGILALGAGALSLLPLVAPLAAVFASMVSLVGLFLSARFPEKYAGQRKMMLGLGLCVAGMGLFLAEGGSFWKWKIDQAYAQRLAISRLRMSEIAEALERYRQEKGAYPEVSGAMLTKDLLEPAYITALSPVDGFDGVISVECRPEGFTLRAFPPPPPGANGVQAPPLTVTGRFHPAPAPPPPPLALPPTDASPGAGPDGPVPAPKEGGPPPTAGDGTPQNGTAAPQEAPPPSP